jgi:hypothetical protein
MLLDTSHAPLPQIDTLIDDQVWSPPGAVMGLSGIDASTWIGQRTMGSTTFHWTARLAIICRSVLHTLSVPLMISLALPDSQITDASQVRPIHLIGNR